MNKSDDLRSFNKRRILLSAGAALSALAWPHMARAQAKPPVVIGWLDSRGRDSELARLNAFNEGMTALGWKMGAQYVLEERWADGYVERLPALAQELAAKKPAVIVAGPSASVRTAAAAAPATPIVLTDGDPLGSGLVKSLARPGGLITGVSNISTDMNQKVIELLVESLPMMRRVGFLADSTMGRHVADVNKVRRAAQHYRVEAIIAEMAKPADIEPAMARLAKDKVQALVILSNSWFGSHYPKIMKLALAQRWPVAGTLSTFPELGGLFSYGANRAGMARRAAYYVDRILKGTKPSDLPIEQPTTFDMVLNLKTARTLGIPIPQTIMVRTTRVIE